MKKFLSLALMAVLAIAAWADTAVFDFVNNGTSLFPGITAGSSNSSTAGDITEDKTATVNGVSLTVSASSGSTSNRLWADYNSGKLSLRVYGGTITVAAPAGKNLTAITFSNSRWSEPTASAGSFTGSTWVGNAQSVVFTIGGQCRLDSVRVTFGEGGATPDPQPGDSSLAKLATFKQFGQSVADSTRFQFTGNAIVCYQYKNYLFVRDIDSEGYPYSALIYGKLDKTYENGDIIPAGWTGTKVTYRGMPEIVDVEGLQASSAQADETLSDVIDYTSYLGFFAEAISGYEADYATFTDVTLSAIDDKGNFTITEDGYNSQYAEGTYTLAGYNQFGIDYPTSVEGKQFTIDGLLYVHNNVAQLLPTAITENDTSLPLWKIWYSGDDSTQVLVRDTLYVVKATKVLEPEDGSKNFIYVTDNATQVLFDLYADWGLEPWYEEWTPDFYAIDCGDDEQLYNAIAGMKVIAPRTLKGTVYNNFTNPRIVVTEAPTAMTGVEFPEIAYEYCNLNDTLNANGNQLAYIEGVYKTVNGQPYLTGENGFQPIKLDYRYLGSAPTSMVEGGSYRMFSVVKQLEPWEEDTTQTDEAPALAPRKALGFAARAPKAAPAGPRRMIMTAPNYYDNYVICPLETPASTAVSSVNADKAVRSTSYVNLAGQRSSKPFEGVNVVVTTYTDGTQAVSKVIK